LFFVLDICKLPAQKSLAKKTVSANFAEYSVECKVKTCRVALKNRPPLFVLCFTELNQPYSFEEIYFIVTIFTTSVSVLK